MYNSRKKHLEEIPTEITPIWKCSNDECSGWMRDNFTFSAQPSCPHCNSSMVKGEKELQTIVNLSPTSMK